MRAKSREQIAHRAKTTASLKLLSLGKSLVIATMNDRPRQIIPNMENIPDIDGPLMLKELLLSV